jgi:predicted small lipoprotein YifL
LDDESQILVKMKTIKMKNLNMKTALRWSLASMVLFALSGCGLKGPLYFPPADKADGKKVVVTNAKPGQVTGVSPDQNAQKNGSVQY